MTKRIAEMKPSDTRDGKRYRLDQMQKMIELFKAAHSGKPPTTTKEVDDWINSPEGVAASAEHRNENGTINPY